MKHVRTQMKTSNHNTKHSRGRRRDGDDNTRPRKVDSKTRSGSNFPSKRLQRGQRYPCGVRKVGHYLRRKKKEYKAGQRHHPIITTIASIMHPHQRLACTSERFPMFSFRRVKLSLLAPSPSEASRMAFSRAGASVPTSVSSGKKLSRRRGGGEREGSIRDYPGWLGGGGINERELWSHNMPPTVRQT